MSAAIEIMDLRKDFGSKTAVNNLSLAIPEPLASGQTPDTFREHIQQRTRWRRGVISTGKKLKIMNRKGLTLEQRLSY